jgi:hypothetical protein
VPRRLPGGRFPAGVESAAYFATVESLRLTERDVTVDAATENGSLSLVIGAEMGPGDGIVQIRDRVGAVGGTVAFREGELHLEMPCGS